MTTRTLIGGGALCLATMAWATPARMQFPWALPSCRHVGAATAEDKARRDQAVTLARRINAAQASSVRSTGRHVPLERLGRLPAIPAGFDLRLHVDDDGYLFALKDGLDPCHFAIFSDEAGMLYETSALQAPIVARFRHGPRSGPRRSSAKPSEGWLRGQDSNLRMT